VYDLNYTFGRRLRAAGVTEEDREACSATRRQNYQPLLGGRTGQLIDEANKISATDSRGPALTILRRKAR